MHENEVIVGPELVAGLIADQFPQWSELPVEPVPSAGTDNALFRLGEDLVVRLPRIDWAVPDIEKESEWLPRLAPQLPLAIPEPVERGEPGEGYPWPWAVYRWVAGEHATRAWIQDLEETATVLGDFLRALRGADAHGAPAAAQHGSRGLPLVTRDARLRECLQELEGEIDVVEATAIWEEALAVPEWSEEPVWFHGDVMPGNLLFADGELCAVIDFGGAAVGDPACDLMVAWNLFEGRSRERFREVVGADDAMWARARGHALAQAVIFIPYYRDTNPRGMKVAWKTLARVLEDSPRRRGG